MGKFDKKSPSSKPQEMVGNAEYNRISPWLAKVKFRKKLFGVDETDVWKKIEELDAMYARALVAERARYDMLLKLASRRSSQEDSGNG